MISRNRVICSQDIQTTIIWFKELESTIQLVIDDLNVCSLQNI